MAQSILNEHHRRVLEALAAGDRDVARLLSTLAKAPAEVQVDLAVIATALSELDNGDVRIVAPVIARSKKLEWKGLERLSRDSDVLQMIADLKRDDDVLQNKGKRDDDVLQSKGKRDDDVLQNKGKRDNDVLQNALRALAVLGASGNKLQRPRPTRDPLQVMLSLAGQKPGPLALQAAFVRFEIAFRALVAEADVFPAMARLRRRRHLADLRALARLAYKESLTNLPADRWVLRALAEMATKLTALGKVG